MRMLTTYIPTRRFASDLWSEMDRFFDTWNEEGNRSISKIGFDDGVFSPACEVKESSDYFLMSVDLPGMKHEDIKIELTDDLLTVSGQRKREIAKENQKWQRFEKSYGYFKRSFVLPNAIDADKIETNYENGVLELYLPKTSAAKPRNIQIQSGKSGFFEKLLGSKKTNPELKDVTTSKIS